MVYCGLYPSDGQDFNELREALDKLSLNDPSFEFEPETQRRPGLRLPLRLPGPAAHGDHPAAAGRRERRRPGADRAERHLRDPHRNGETLQIHKPQEVPDAGQIEEFREPIVRVNFILPAEYIGPVMQLCEDRRGIYVQTEYLSPTRAMLVYDLPLAEVIYDLHDKLKSATRGYGTMDYELIGYEPADLVPLDILVNGNRVDALSVICHRDDADRRGRGVCKKLKDEIDRHMFEVAIQAAIGSRVIARETKPAMRKNVTAKCYGGDITRKRKLWAKQKEGKKRMKSIGQVEIPQKAFLAVLETGEEK